MKKIFAFLLCALIAALGVTAASAADDEASGAEYSVVSAKINKSYDFKDDFHDSCLVDDDFYTEGVFRMSDHNCDVTLTLKNNTTGEEFVYEKNDDTEWYLSASIDHLLYETSQVDAALNIADLGGDYSIKDEEIPVSITVESSLYSADFHKYPSYIANTVMYEGKDYTIDYDAASPGNTAKVTILSLPNIFELEIYNVETEQIEYYDTDNGNFIFEGETDVPDYDPQKGSFWFFAPCKLVMDDGYEFEFTLSVNAFPPQSDTATPDEADGKSTKDSATPDSVSASYYSGIIKTGEPMAAYILAITVLVTAAGAMLYIRKRNKVQ